MRVIAAFSEKHRQKGGVLLGLSLLLAPSVASTATPPVPTPDVSTTETFTASDQSFTFVLPKNWKKNEKGHPYGDLTPIFGVKLSGPMEPNGVPITISVLHYSGERRFTTPDAFIHNKLNSLVRIDYEREALITDTKVAGRPAKAFRIKTFKLVYLPQLAMSPMREGIVYELSPPHKQIDMVERYLVVPASKGYFVLSYCAPERMVEEHRGVFDQVVGSFQPQLP